VSSESTKAVGWKARVRHELVEFLVTALLLSLFLGAVADYRRVILADFGISYTHWGIALIEALIISKVILIGDVLHLGRRSGRSVFGTAVQRAIGYGFLILGFELVEHGVRALVHGETFDAVRASIVAHSLDFAAYAFLTFVFLVPFFALRAAANLLGEEGLAELLFKTRGSTSSRWHEGERRAEQR
jgi:hypothetical protein